MSCTKSTVHLLAEESELLKSLIISVHQLALHSFPDLRSLGEIGSVEGWFHF